MLSFCLFSIISFIALFKGIASTSSPSPLTRVAPIEVELAQDVQIIQPQAPKPTITHQQPVNKLPTANRIQELFNVDGPKLPIVETIVYKSRVPWQKGRPAWLSDYARYYQTSRHFIARSLNGKPDYYKQDLVEGARFNVLRKDMEIQFHLVVDLSLCKLWLYYEDMATQKRTLLKDYPICLGRVDGSKQSGFLTPLGKYSLGNKTAIYKPKMLGHYRGEQIEMITVFGTRWIPFDKELENCTAPSKGLGIHGLPWLVKGSGKKEEDRSSLNKYESDGCIRMASEDLEELFAIIIARPAVIHLVKEM